jgi:hypothetical protein
MAHQVRDGISVTLGPRMVLQRHALAALLGTIAAEWAQLEVRIMHLYAYLMGVYLPRSPGWEPPIHPVALQVFDTLETLRLRLSLLRKLGSWVLKSEALERELKEVVLDSIERAAKMRNTMLHAEWGIAPEYPDALILLPTFGHQMVYEESDFHEAIDRIVEARSCLGRFEVKARSHLDPKPNV